LLVRLPSSTTRELRERLDQAATSMEQIIVPLQWTSTAEPITAKAVSGPDGTYTVDCFVSVRTTNAQAPEGIVSTAT
jgi:Mce-associated membrane protein